jgi:hypothetical protein
MGDANRCNIAIAAAAQLEPSAGRFPSLAIALLLQIAQRNCSAIRAERGPVPEHNRSGHCTAAAIAIRNIATAIAAAKLRSAIAGGGREPSAGRFPRSSAIIGRAIAQLLQSQGRNIAIARPQHCNRNCSSSAIARAERGPAPERTRPSALCNGAPALCAVAWRICTVLS